jgi:two-component system, response regulator YesN
VKDKSLLDLAREEAAHYTRATGMSCFVIDDHGDSPDSSPCAFCTRQLSSGRRTVDCPGVHLYGAYQAERFGGRYFYFCPASFLHWASPLLDEGKMVGALVGGPALMVEEDAVFLDNIAALSGLSREEARELVKEIPSITPEEAESQSRTLFAHVFQLCTRDEGIIRDSREREKQQRAIGEYIQTIKEGSVTEAGSAPYPLKKEQDMIQAIQVGDIDEARKLLNEILGAILFNSGNDFSLIRTRVLELLVLLSRAAMEAGADEQMVLGLNSRYFREINRYNTVEGLTAWLARVIDRFARMVFDLREIKHADAIYRAIRYVKKHFTRKVTLEEAADQAYLSPAYFSKIFKEEMGCGFATYLNTLRVERSKDFLRNRSIPLTDVAGMVGFEDQSYYTRVFKKLTGRTPGKYRESRGLSGKNQEIHQ